MALHLILPQFEAGSIVPPSHCPRRDCRGKMLRLHQQVVKPVRDSPDRSVVAYRYQCLTCGRTFRVYPHGVSNAHTSRRVQHLAVLLYFLGLSYGAVAEVMDALKVYLSKSRVYEAVRSASFNAPVARLPILRNVNVPHRSNRRVVLECYNRKVLLELTHDPTDRLILTLHTASTEDARRCSELIQPLAEALGIEMQVGNELVRAIGVA